MDSPRLMRRLRAAFDARVFNHGDYNLVYGQPSGSSTPLVIGYRHVPLEMVLCPVDPAAEPVLRAPQEPDPVTVGLHNVATVADTGSGYQVETVTGFRTWFDVSEHARVPVGDLTEDGVADLDQRADAADFHGFMTAFMDELDRLYAVSDPAEAVMPDPGLDGTPKTW
ncbi:hypothetical protein KZX06_00810 [Micrococcus sp. EYE_162]|uniref:hypothetical protein n=1 Tax=unclassified Micrococcus TaxID=2620948 RepID=UPI002004B56E|nr:MULTISPECIES: hypothetical protein [unclassified Micrococcus]MCK6094413.1 hypothetical protein [Micrococcus sp. EYE_212]MCK6170594.1 hypothetical protein [Micrococcus sp. EYE_162]